MQDESKLPDGLRTLLIDDGVDPTVPIAQTTALADALRAASTDISATIFPRPGAHGLHRRWHRRAAHQGVDGYLADILKRRGVASSR